MARNDTRKKPVKSPKVSHSEKAQHHGPSEAAESTIIGTQPNATTSGKSQSNHAVKFKIADPGHKKDLRGKETPAVQPRRLKRDARGKIKSINSGALLASGSSHDITNSSSQQLLLQEILALGGTEDDLDLVAGSDSEGSNEFQTDGTDGLDPRLKTELGSFLDNLGIMDHREQVLANFESDEIGDFEVGSSGKGPYHDEQQTSSSPINKNLKVDNPTKEVQSLKQQRSPLKSLVFGARPDWHAATLCELPKFDSSRTRPSQDIIADLKQHAAALLEIDVETYASKTFSQNSSHRFLSTIMTSGTLSDKVSALTLVIQESPVHTARSLESLVALARKRSRGQAMTALGALKDLLGQGVVLPTNRRLRVFNDQPGLLGALQGHPTLHWKPGKPLPGAITESHLISWAYEDWLKNIYFDVMKILESWCNDEIEYSRNRAVTYVFELLRDKPEQESNLLRLLVNKLGDPEKKIASRASYFILQLQTTHPLMKPIIVKSIENELLLRPGQTSHAKYYAINTLNQTILSAKEEEVARELLGIYFSLFVILLKKPLNVQNQGPVLNRKGQLQGGGGQKGRKAKAKATKEEASNIAREEVIEKLISAVLTGVNRAFPFARPDDITLEKHMDLLFRITHSSNFNTSIQALMLIQQLASSKNVGMDRFFRTLYESLLDPRLVTSSKHAMYLNLLFRALKSDLNIKRVKAFVKRLVQIITLHQPPFICGVLYLLRELEAHFNGLTTLVTNPEELDNMDEEVFIDVEEDGTIDVANAPFSLRKTTPPIHAAKLCPPRKIYDGRKRDPEHSEAERSCLWELLPFRSHFHPSVSMFASNQLYQSDIVAKPDLTSHTLMAFLDRFVYRNAKTSGTALRGSSIMQPLAGGESSTFLVPKKMSISGHYPLNSEAFWRAKAEDVAADEVFFHKYFNTIGKATQSSKKMSKPKTPQSSDLHIDEDDGDADDDEIWDALVESRPELEDDSGDQSDLESFDLGDSEESSVDTETDVRMESEDDNDIASDLDPFSDEDIQIVSNQNADSEFDVPKSGRNDKRRKVANLPTFASIEDYAKLLDEEEDEDFGLAV